MDEIVKYAIYFCITLAGSLLVSSLYMRYKHKKIATQAIRATLDVYGKKLIAMSEYIQEVCPTCAYYNTAQCDKVDVNNLVAFGRCTNFERRRF